MSAYLFLVIALVLNAAANLLVKYAAVHQAPVAPDATGMTRILATYVSVPFLLGISCFGLNLLAYTQALKRLPISTAYPVMVSLGYLLILVVSWFLFQERLGVQRYVGAALMIAGLWLLLR